MFYRVLGIPEPHLPARDETDVGEKGLQRVGKKPGWGDLPFQLRAAWRRTPSPQVSVSGLCGEAGFGLQTGVYMGKRGGELAMDSRKARVRFEPRVCICSVGKVPGLLRGA